MQQQPADMNLGHPCHKSVYWLRFGTHSDLGFESIKYLAHLDEDRQLPWTGLCLFCPCTFSQSWLCVHLWHLDLEPSLPSLWAGPDWAGPQPDCSKSRYAFSVSGHRTMPSTTSRFLPLFRHCPIKDTEWTMRPQTHAYVPSSSLNCF